MRVNAGLLAFVAALALPGVLAAAPPAASPAPPVAPSADAPDARPAYTLAPGDKLRVTVFDAPNLSGTFAVNPRGDVALPLIGDIAARNQTSDGLAAIITTRLAQGYVKDPRVSVEIITYRPYYILGEVNKPGEFPFVEGLTVQQAVAAAGGYTYRAAKRSAFVRAAGGPEVHRKLGDSAVYIRPGDTIRIGERYF